MSHDDRMLHEGPTPIRSTDERVRPEYIVPLPEILPRQPRTPEQQIAALHREVDDLHERDGRLESRARLTQLALAGFVWYAVGFWPAGFAWELATRSWFTVFATGIVAMVLGGGIAQYVWESIKSYDSK